MKNHIFLRLLVSEMNNRKYLQYTKTSTISQFFEVRIPGSIQIKSFIIVAVIQSNFSLFIISNQIRFLILQFLFKINCIELVNCITCDDAYFVQ